KPLGSFTRLVLPSPRRLGSAVPSQDVLAVADDSDPLTHRFAYRTRPTARAPPSAQVHDFPRARDLPEQSTVHHISRRQGSCRSLLGQARQPIENKRRSRLEALTQMPIPPIPGMPQTHRQQLPLEYSRYSLMQRSLYP